MENETQKVVYQLENLATRKPVFTGRAPFGSATEACIFAIEHDLHGVEALPVFVPSVS